MSYSLNSLKEVVQGIRKGLGSQLLKKGYRGEYYEVINEDTRSLD